MPLDTRPGDEAHASAQFQISPKLEIFDGSFNLKETVSLSQTFAGK